MDPGRPKRRAFPRTLGECVERAAQPAMNKHGMMEAQLLRHWEAIVGPELAVNAHPHRVIRIKSGSGDVLVVRTSGGFATEIQHMEPVILERIATYFGHRAFARLRIEQTAAASPKRKRTPDAASLARAAALRKLAEALQTQTE